MGWGRDTPWVVFGAYDKADKCVIGTAKGLGGMHELAVCRLKPDSDHRIGSQTVETDEIEGIIYHICFGRRESLVAFTEACQKMLEGWKEDK